MFAYQNAFKLDNIRGRSHYLKCTWGNATQKICFCSKRSNWKVTHGTAKKTHKTK